MTHIWRTGRGERMCHNLLFVKLIWGFKIKRIFFVSHLSWYQDSKNTFTPNSRNQTKNLSKLAGIRFFYSTCGQNMSLWGLILMAKKWILVPTCLLRPKPYLKMLINFSQDTCPIIRSRPKDESSESTKNCGGMGPKKVREKNLKHH